MTCRHAVSAMTLFEMAAIIAVSGLILGGSVQVLMRLQRLADVDTARGVRAEMASDQLRRDLARGKVEVIPGGLTIAVEKQILQWTLHDGQLERNGRQVLAVNGFDAAQIEHRMVITIKPIGLPSRRIESSP